MFLPSEKLRRIGWNERVLTQADFDNFCESNGVLVVDADIKWRGIYMDCEGIPCIVIKATTSGVERAEIAWHELGHHLIHAPATCFFSRNAISKSEYEAHLIPACALIPRPLMNKTFGELQEEYGYSRELIWFRKRAYERFKL